MACLSPVSGPTPRDVQLADRKFLRSISCNDLRGTAKIKRSNSDTHLCYSSGRIKASMVGPKLRNSHSFEFFNIEVPSAMIPDTLKALLLDRGTSREIKVEENLDESDRDDALEIDKAKRSQTNWIERLMELRKNWKEKEENGEGFVCGESGVGCNEEDEGCYVEYEDEDEDEETKIEIDREIFSSLLRNVPWSDAKLFSQLAFLCNMAYVIEDIKTEDLKRYYGLDFVTSSLEKKAQAAVIKKKIEQDSIRIPIAFSNTRPHTSEPAKNSEPKTRLILKAAYDIAASAASYVQSRTDLILLGSEPQLTENSIFLHDEQNNEIEEDLSYSTRIYNSEMAACVAASTMTVLVAAGEKEKEAAAKGLQSLHSSPCEWFVCDDSSLYTRCFVIQGSDSLASWQANLFFEPTKFERTDVLVHRGMYEAAKGIYDQFMPEIEQHLNKLGDRAKLQFTGHSLGGSLALLVNLMLLTRNKVKKSALLPVVTFGSPHVFCGGHKILDQLGLDENHIHCVMMHRDIVPRAFSCNYPNYVAQLLKRLNGKFRFHPCLNKKKLLYTPMGKVFILQPDEKSSPHHPLLPTGKAIYSLDNTNSFLTKRATQAFLNNPHPLETLSDPTAYGSEGTILRDHESSNYLKAVNEVIRQHMRLVVRKARQQRNQLWPLLTSRSPHAWSHTNDVKAREKVLTGV